MKIYNYNGKKNLCGEKIRCARLMKNLTQTELAAKIQVAGITLERDSISRIEIGTRFVADYELKEFAKILGVTSEWLLGEGENEHSVILRQNEERAVCNAGQSIIWESYK